jgi:hypothetical protein
MKKAASSAAFSLAHMPVHAMVTVILHAGVAIVPVPLLVISAVGVRIAGSQVLAVGVRIVLSAFSRIGYYFLR